MVPARSLRVLEVVWSGPHSVLEVAALGTPADRGLLQVYGTHPVFGSDALLYVDAAHDATFAARLQRIDAWLRLLPSPPALYVGRLGGTTEVTLAEWQECIQAAHRLAAFFHAPPWNSREIDHHGISEPTVVLNLGHRHRLALEVSNLWDASAWEPGGTRWAAWAPAKLDQDPAEEDPAEEGPAGEDPAKEVPPEDAPPE